MKRKKNKIENKCSAILILIKLIEDLAHMNALKRYQKLSIQGTKDHIMSQNITAADDAYNITQELISLYLNEINKTGIMCVCIKDQLRITSLKNNLQCQFCNDKNDINNRYKVCQPLYQQWNVPSQRKTLGVLINVKCGHRGSYSDKERDLLKYWLKEAKFINEDPEFIEQAQRNDTFQSNNEEEKSFKDLMDTPNRKNSDVPKRKSIK